MLQRRQRQLDVRRGEGAIPKCTGFGGQALHPRLYRYDIIPQFTVEPLY